MTAPKLQRWIDLLASLLSHRYAVTLEQLIQDVPAYAQGQSKATLRRMFERDKDDLRRFGVLIETVPETDAEPTGYKLAAREFYLPYLALMAEGRVGRPGKLGKPGYFALPTLVFEPDELDAIARAAVRVRELGDPLLAEDADSALRKLAVDLPIDVAAPGDTHVVPGRPAAAAEVFSVLGTALDDRKIVTFDYHSMGADAVSRRTVEPFGLFFLNQHWYLAGRPPGETVVKNFRLSRIADPKANTKSPGTHDYAIPPDFRLRDHARSKQAWELGDGDAVDAIVELRRDVGAAYAAARLGEPVDGLPNRRLFRVRRPDTFTRWLLSFAGDIVPVFPPELVAEFRTLVHQTLVHHTPDRQNVPPIERPS